MSTKKVNTRALYIGMVLLILIAMSFVFFVNTNKGTSQSLPTVDMHFDLVEKFDSVEELYEKSNIIAQVKVGNTNTIEYGNVAFTLSNVEIIKVFKGDLDKKSTISILETGGTHDGLIYRAEGNAVFTKSDQAIVYLEKYEGPIADNSYVIKGVYQGKFKVNGEKITPPNEVDGNIESVKSIKDLKLHP
ncbi:hypothetical protein [Paenibacillus sp. PL2-23]|uniref:hypothetical protein n=1 Tax=Paenibacillus sp. PL2-23 TaxID=2100729 RepID=UPI0030F59406